MVSTQDSTIQRGLCPRFFSQLVRRSRLVRALMHLLLLPLIISDRCALIHCHRPDLLDYDNLDKVNACRTLHDFCNDA
jgi:hypothetical protein